MNWVDPTGAGSQISELRAGHLDSAGNFVDAPGGSLINDRAINAAIQEHVPVGENIRTLRMSTNCSKRLLDASSYESQRIDGSSQGD